MVKFLSISAQSDDTLNKCLSDIRLFTCALPTLQADFFASCYTCTHTKILIIFQRYHKSSFRTIKIKHLW